MTPLLSGKGSNETKPRGKPGEGKYGDGPGGKEDS